MAAPQGGGAAQGNPIMGFLPLILIFAIFYFLLIRPQQKRQKEHQNMLSSIKAGDEVVTVGGIHAKIEKVIDQNTYIAEIANGVKVKISKTGIAQKTAIAQTTTEEK